MSIVSPSLMAARGPTRRSLSRARALHQRPLMLVNAGWLCIVAALALTLVGIVSIATTEPHYAFKHLAHLCVGIIAAALLVLPHYRRAMLISYPLLAVVLALLVFVLIPAVPDAIVRPRNGARRWINLQWIDFQPSELAKIVYILALAGYLRFRSNYRSFGGLLLPLALTFLPMALVLVEPDLGTAMLFLPTFFAMVLAAGAKLRHVAIIIVLGLAVAPAMYPLLAPHQRHRIQALYYQVVGDTRHESDIGYQGAKAMTLVGAGGVRGVGRQHAADLIRFNHLPENHNDMVFAVITCRWGILGAIGVWSLFGLFVLGGLATAATCKEPFGRLVAVGIIAIMFAQMTINSGMTIGLMPITGMTLPFVSAGGTSLISAWIMVGLLFNIALRRSNHMTRKSFEFDKNDERLT